MINSAAQRTLRQSRIRMRKHRGTSDSRQGSWWSPSLRSTVHKGQSRYSVRGRLGASVLRVVRRSIVGSRSTARLDSETGCRARSDENISSSYSAPCHTYSLPLISRYSLLVQMYSPGGSTSTKRLVYTQRRRFKTKF